MTLIEVTPITGGGRGTRSVADTQVFSPASSDDADRAPRARPHLPRALQIAVVWSGRWTAPHVTLTFWPGSEHMLVKEGVFFSKAATVTFSEA